MEESKMKTAGVECRFTSKSLIWLITNQVASAVSEVSYLVFIGLYMPLLSVLAYQKSMVIEIV